jgi:hypothetical protein
LLSRYCIVGGGVQLSPLGILVTNRPIVPAPGDYDDGEIGGMVTGRGNRSTRSKPALMPFCPPQTIHAARKRTRAAAVGIQRLTASATARPCSVGIIITVRTAQPRNGIRFLAGARYILFSVKSRLILDLIKFIQWEPGVISLNVKLHIHLHPPRMSEARPPFPQYALIARCLITLLLVGWDFWYCSHYWAIVPAPDNR